VTVCCGHEWLQPADQGHEYRERGFEVVVAPKRDEVPSFLRSYSYLPDMVATSPVESVVIEVKSRKTMRDAKNFAAIADHVREQDGWDFMLVYTNPRQKPGPATQRAKQSKETIHELISWAKERANRGSQTSRLAALLLLWSAFEAVTTRALSPRGKNARPRMPIGLIRDAAIEGMISKDSRDFLERLIEKRNEVAHGNLSESVSSDELTRLIDACEEILAQS